MMEPPLPPPPPPRPDTTSALPAPAPASAAVRPQTVTAAAAIVIVLGVLQVLAGLVFLFVRLEDLARIGSIGSINVDRVARGLGLFSLVIGTLEIGAGILVLRLSDAGRIFAIVLASIGLLGGIGSLSGGSPLGVVTLGSYGFVIYTLFAHASVFRGTRRG